MFDLAGKRIYVAGHRGMVGGAIARQLVHKGCEVLTAPRSKLDLMDQRAVFDWIAETKPDAVVVAAAKVGGILANNSFPADFLYDNLLIEANLIGAAHAADVDRLLFLGSSCIYPKFAEQPIQESSLLTGPLEPTNEWYAIAKIAGIKLCQAFRRQYGRDYISGMPTNLYGPGDNFDLQSSHVIPALMRKAYEAKEAGSAVMEIWGTGTPRREFLHVEDCADACIFLLQNYSGEEHVNIGSGEDLPIFDLATLITEVVGFEGEIVRDKSKPDGTPRKLMAADRLRSLGWRSSISLREGLATTYSWFLQNVVRPAG
ncbi:MAG: GDP-L-fucose synthase [Qipengyuania sp.]|uniref:GDP-L-fucose synthase n=1 Tax=Qipengyuania sp. TaxID=2004515 RepID=UPI003001E767